MEKGGHSLGGVASRSAARSGGVGIDRSLLGWRGAGEARRMRRATSTWPMHEEIQSGPRRQCTRKFRAGSRRPCPSRERVRR